MGGISLWHWIILFVFFVLPVLAVAVGGLVWFLVRRSRGAVRPVPTLEARLHRLDALLANGTITQGEHERQRADILRSL